MISFRNLQEYQVVVKGYKVQTSSPEDTLAKYSPMAELAALPCQKFAVVSPYKSTTNFYHLTSHSWALQAASHNYPSLDPHSPVGFV
jgi:hypothetical protein